MSSECTKEKVAPILVSELFHFIIIFDGDVSNRSLVTKVQKDIEDFLGHVFNMVIFLVRIQIKKDIEISGMGS